MLLCLSQLNYVFTRELFVQHTVHQLECFPTSLHNFEQSFLLFLRKRLPSL